jgi:hypothetical protein
MLNRLKKYGVDLAGSIFKAGKRYDGERNFESSFGISSQISDREQTPRKVKTGRRLQRYSMHQYIIAEKYSEPYVLC